MKINDIENHFKKTFRNHKAAIDTDEVWANIEGQLEEKRDRKPFFWWFFGGLAGLAIAAFLFWPSNSQQESGIHSTNNNNNRLSNTTTTNTTINNPALKDPGSDNNATMPSSPAIPIANESKPTATRVKTTPLATTMAVQLTEKANPANNKSEAKNQLTTAPGKTETAPPPTQSFGLLPPLPNQLSLLNSDLSLAEQKKDLAVTNEEKTLSNRPKRIKVKKRWIKSIDLYAGPLQSLRVFNLKGEGKNLGGLRKEYERSIPGYVFGSQFNMMNRNGLILSAGLEFTQANEKLDFFREQFEESSVNGVEAYVLDRNNQVKKTIPGQQTLSTTIQKTVIHHNRYRSINLPIGIGKRLIYKKFNVELIGGVDLNLRSFYKGRVIREIDNFPTMEFLTGRDGRAAYKVRTGMGLWASGHFNRFVNGNFALFARPSIRVPLGSMTTDAYELKHRQYLFSLKVGGRFYL